MNETPTLLLVHGAWHGPWCWDRFTPELDRRGLAWRAVSLPCVGDTPKQLGGVEDDIATIETAARSIDGEVVVLAHSYGGIPVTGAKYPDSVTHLIYLGAFMPDAGQSLVDLLPPGPLPPFVVDNGDGTTSVEPGLAVQTFYADCDPQTAEWATSRLRLHNGVCNATPVRRAAWRETPSTYILLTEDHACPTMVQRQVHKQARATIELEGSHSPFLAKPTVLAEIVARILLSGDQERVSAA